jgi:hypothetical protein
MAAQRNTPQGIERRVFNTHIEVRSASEDGSIPMVGHAALFDTRAEIVPGFFEVIARGAFTTAIGRDDVRMLINHDSNLILARTSAGTLRLSEDETGLATDADMAPTSYGKDLAISMERGDISQMSFAFQAEVEDWQDLPDGSWLRTVRQAKLYDVSPVTYPAYDGTDAALRSAAMFNERVQEMRDAQRVHSLDVRQRRLRLRSK